MTINDRVKALRKSLNLTQIEFGKKIAIAQGYLTNIENGYREVTDKIIKLICLEFNVNEDYLRNGTLPMFNQDEVFSLDKYAKERSASDIDIEILKIYLNLDKDVRKKIVSDFKKIFVKTENTYTVNEISATKQNTQIDNEKASDIIKQETQIKPEPKYTSTIMKVPARGSETGYFEFEMTEEMQNGFEEDLNYDDSDDTDLY